MNVVQRCLLALIRSLERDDDLTEERISAFYVVKALIKVSDNDKVLLSIVGPLMKFVIRLLIHGNTVNT